MTETEVHLCATCNMYIPVTNLHLSGEENNMAEQLFRGRIPVVRVSSFFFYVKGESFSHAVHRIKYGGDVKLGEYMGRRMAEELLSSGFFDGIDVLVPVPLHAKRLRRRGYNQSEVIARGVSGVTGIPVCTAGVVRSVNSESQVRKSAVERRRSMTGVFILSDSLLYEGKHVLIIDDVLTTGSTIMACASVFVAVEGIQISVLTLAMVK